MQNRKAADAAPGAIRTGNPDLLALGLRVGGLEGRMASVELDVKGARKELRETSKIVLRTHVLIEGTQAVPGIRTKVDGMYEAFDTARSGFRLIGKVGDFIDSNGRRFFWVAIAVLAVGAYFKTGHFPDWLGKIVG